MAGWVGKGASRGGSGGRRLVPGLDVRVGQLVAGKYRVERLLGASASGVVISAENIHLRQPVALKILASYTDAQHEAVQRSLQHARIAAGFRGRHLARVVDIGTTEDGMSYIASGSLNGTTLESELEARGRLPVTLAVRLILEACEGLAEGHAAGLVHGDLKPKNVFLVEPEPSDEPRPSGVRGTGEDRRTLKILDFGIANPLGALGDHGVSAFFGSPAFLAPEQIQNANAVDARADVWALGALLYTSIAGSLPFSADTVSGVLVAVVYDVPAFLTDAPYALAQIVHRCLEKDPEKRPSDVAELAAELAPFGGSEGPRLAQRVRDMLLGSGPPIPTSAQASSSGSIRAVSVSLDPSDADDADSDDSLSEDSLPLPLLTRSTLAGGADPLARSFELTRPSMRVIARRRMTRARIAAFGVLAVAASILVGAVGTTAHSFLRSRQPSALSSTFERTANEEPASVERASVVAAQREVGAVNGTAMAPEMAVASARSTAVELLPDAPPVSFAPGPTRPLTPTPLAGAPSAVPPASKPPPSRTPLPARAAPLPARAAPLFPMPPTRPTLLPQPRSGPTSRAPSPRAPSPDARAVASPSRKLSAPVDNSYLRLFPDAR